jgi:UDP-2-acetamido-2,6-beta-L-arabino-hexul-4-ose reductase
VKILVTGAGGFIGRNLRVRLGERDGWSMLPVTRETTPPQLRELAGAADAVVHLAGVNRPKHVDEFDGNRSSTQELVSALRDAGRAVPVLFASSIQIERDNDYGRSKLAAEQMLAEHSDATGAPVAVLRLPNVFGKWCRPDYNSAVATFCHRIARGEPVEVHDPAAPLRLVYIDDVLSQIMAWLEAPAPGFTRPAVSNVYATTVGEVVDQIRAFGEVRRSLVTERVGTGLVRALYATYVSCLPTSGFAYPVPRYGDARGVFVEMLKTPDCGQFSFFTAHPGITRGGHYHHTKTEKFLVIKGRARFRFRHIDRDERFELETSGDEPTIVETIPGWSHDITNIGEDEMVVMLWANEIFDRARPDTVASAV